MITTDMMIKICPVRALLSGITWDEVRRDKIGGILVYYGPNIIYALQFMYYENNKLVFSSKHGVTKRDQDFCSIVFDYPSEYLTSISGSYGDTENYLTSIKFNTNKGYYSPFGTRLSVNAKDFNFYIGNQHLFGGFNGTATSRGVESIGVYVKTITGINFAQDSNPIYF